MNYENVYENVFKINSYNSDTSESYSLALKFLQDNKDSKIICDIGSGRGNLVKKILSYSKEYKINCYDLSCFLESSLLDSVLFNKMNLSLAEEAKTIKNCDLLFCLDVLEHIEEKYIDDILKTFAEKSFKVFLTIANHSDIFNNKELHLIQKNNVFWNEKLIKFFNLLNYEERYGGRLMIYSLESKK